MDNFIRSPSHIMNHNQKKAYPGLFLTRITSVNYYTFNQFPCNNLKFKKKK